MIQVWGMLENYYAGPFLVAIGFEICFVPGTGVDF
jgi:hypothetical protein